MSDVKARNAVIRCIARVVKPHLYPSGYVDGSEPDGHLQLWSPQKAKAFSKNTTITSLYAVGKDWIADDAHSGGMVSTQMRHIPIEDLANILEWLLSVDLEAIRFRRKER